MTLLEQYASAAPAMQLGALYVRIASLAIASALGLALLGMARILAGGRR